MTHWRANNMSGPAKRSLNKVGRSELTAAMVRNRFDYNPATGAFTRRIAEAGSSVGDVAGTTTSDGYVKVRVFYLKYAAHRLAWLYMHGTWPLGEIDHIDGNRRNNAFANLREATRSQNQQNREQRGYAYCKRDKKFIVQVQVAGIKQRIGRYDTADEARSAYLEAKDRIAGGFSFTNRGRAVQPQPLGAQ